MKIRMVLTCWLLVSLAGVLSAAEHRVEVSKEAIPSEVAPAIAEKLASTGLTVIRGKSRTVCEIWPAKVWTVQPDFEPTAQVLYPFNPGDLMGVIRFKNKGSDFRDQDIAAGVYTMRYALQPVDGNHVGTSPTRDFFVLLKADQDTSPDPIVGKKLFAMSAEAAGSGHPALMPLQRLEGESGELPSIRHLEEPDWWIVRFAVKTKSNGKAADIPVDLLVAGQASE